MLCKINRKSTVLFILLLSVSTWAATCISVGSGNWSTGATWSCGSEPTCGDSIVIAAGHTVSTTSNKNYSGCGSLMVLVIRGTLQFGNGDKYQFPCNTRMYVFGAGRIVSAGGGGNSNNIQICGDTEWQAGDGTFSGPGCLPPTLPSCSAVLPITLTYFSASFCEANTVCLDWKTSSEKNNDYYEVQRSINGLLFETSQVVDSKAPGGTTSSKLNYETKDRIADNTSRYYRLKQVDFDKSFSYSDIVFADDNAIVLSPEWNIYPNPGRAEFNISVSGQVRNKFIELKINDNVGKTVYNSILVYNDSGEIPFDTGALLSPGYYICKLVIDGVETQHKLLIH